MHKLSYFFGALFLALGVMLTPTTLFAQGDGEGQCALPWADYVSYVTTTNSYHAALADTNYPLAQEFSLSIQDIIAGNCDPSAVVTITAQDLDDACNSLTRNLRIKYNHYTQAADLDNMSATLGLINTVLASQSCDDIMHDSAAAIAIIQAEIQANETIELQNSVIPFYENICFAPYAPSQGFAAQLQNVNNTDILSNLQNTVPGLQDATTQGGSGIASASLQKDSQNQSTIFGFIQSFVQRTKDTLSPSFNYEQDILPMQVGDTMNMLHDMMSDTGFMQAWTWFDIDMDKLALYESGLLAASLWDTYTQGPSTVILGGLDIQALRAALMTKPKDMAILGSSGVFGEISSLPSGETTPVLYWKNDQEGFGINVLEDDESGSILHISLPSAQDPTQERTLRVFDLQRVNNGDDSYTITKVVMDIVNDAGEQLAAIDMQLDPDGIVLKDYRYIGHFSLGTMIYGITLDQRRLDGGINALETTIDIYGPAGMCNTQLVISSYLNNEKWIAEAQLSINNTDLSIAIADYDGMVADLLAHRTLYSGALSTPTTSNYRGIGIRHQNILRSTLNSFNDTWLVTFLPSESTSWLFPGYIDPIIINLGFDSNFLLTLWNHIQPLLLGETIVVEPVLGCTDPLANNYHPQATENRDCVYEAASCALDPYTISGTINTAITIDVRTNGPYDVTIDRGDGSSSVVGFVASGQMSYQQQVTHTYTGVDAYQVTGTIAFEVPVPCGMVDVTITADQPEEPVYGCTDELANNYDPGATVDNESCTYDPPAPTMGCPDPAATNYDPESNELEGDRDSCTYPPA